PSAAQPREAPLPASTGGAPAAATNAPLPALRLPPRFIGPRVPARGPQWKRGALPAFSPEVLRAMMDPRAARRAQRLRRLGVVLPGASTIPGELGPPPIAPPPAGRAASSGVFPASHGTQI